MSELSTLPVLPLRQAVLFPGVASPIQVGRPASMRAIEHALNTPEKLIFGVCQRRNTDEVAAEDVYTMGTVARIEKVQRGVSGVQLLLHGLHRGLAVRVKEEDDFLQASVRQVEDMMPPSAEDPGFVALFREVRDRSGELGQKSGLPREAVEQVLSGVQEPGPLADLVAGYLQISAEESQELLETLPVEERLRRVLVHVERQVTVLDAQESIKSQVREELGDRQREMFLREQMKAIQRELGESDDDSDHDELRQRLDSLELPEDVRKEVDRELSRLSRLGRESMESQVVRTYLETIAELPWSHRDADQLSLHRAAEILAEDHYGLDDVKDRVLEFLAVRQLRHQAEEQAPAKDAEAAETTSAEATKAEAASDEDREKPREGAANDGDKSEQKKSSRSPILLFVGPPGVGKTSVAKSIARAMGRQYVRISLGGARDEADIRGHRRTYVAAMPGRILQGMKQAGTKNPVFLLDEVDKLGASFQGDPAAALLEVLDPAQNDSFTDHYLGVPFDLSEVMFIATANFIQNIPAPLLDRMEVVEFDGYTVREKVGIARQYLLPRQLEENGLDEQRLAVPDDALNEVITSYTREAGVRQLERALGKLCRKVARKVAEEEVQSLTLEPQKVSTWLGRPKIHPERAAAEDQVGVATGMYYTPTGGDIMFVEASSMPGKGELVLTGQLGDVMKESARAAWTYARAHSAGLRIDRENLFDVDVHVHVPAGAIPKDGPSAGVTLATALVSALSSRPARHDIAMTGEITLTGRVLPIGGVKEKILGGVRAGISHFVLPKENSADLEDLPEDVRNSIRVELVEELGEVLALTLRDASFREGRLLFGDDRPEDVVPLSPAIPH
ncbi:MAG: endopeptidase La [Acidobacteriota bacterium]|nr:endopeptidase La [Acidobacteriota bacterium]